MHPFRAVIFDLDGTLIDGFVPIQRALNRVRAEFSLTPLPLAVVKRQVGHGVRRLVSHSVSSADLDRAAARFEQLYTQDPFDGTQLIDGVGHVLHALTAASIPLAVASNKPAAISDALLERLGCWGAFRCVLGPDHALPPKPAPQMLQRCCQLLAVPVSAALYVGDMTLDVETANQAGLEHRLIATGSMTVDELIAATPWPVMRSLTELLAILGRVDGPDRDGFLQ
jgi:phosphoglycolate phosphatase